MIPRLVRLVFAGIAASALAASSAQAFAPLASSAQIRQSQAVNAPVMPVTDRLHRGRVMHRAPPVVVVRPHHHVRDGLCVTRQPVTSISCYRYLREQQFRQQVVHHRLLRDPVCEGTPRYARRHNTLVFLGCY